jgi:hypothetical protein
VGGGGLGWWWTKFLYAGCGQQVPRRAFARFGMTSFFLHFLVRGQCGLTDSILLRFG